MKLLTLNTHSLLEEHYPEKLCSFVDVIRQEMPDLVALQEVNQTADAAPAQPELLEGMYPLSGSIPVREDNHAAHLAQLLRQAGIPCSWIWLPVKLGYSRYDEGVALLSIGRTIRCADFFPITKTRDYQNWKTRKILGVQLDGLDDWFYSVHMGWWQDKEEPFCDQWNVLNCNIAAKKLCGPVWLLGDFNAPAAVRGESYDRILASGWQDTFLLAQQHDCGYTVPGVIDGWRDKLSDPAAEGMRIDYIFCSRPQDIRTSKVICNGTNYPVVSDHFGIIIETKGTDPL